MDSIRVSLIIFFLIKLNQLTAGNEIVRSNLEFLDEAFSLDSSTTILNQDNGTEGETNDSIISSNVDEEDPKVIDLREELRPKYEFTIIEMVVLGIIFLILVSCTSYFIFNNDTGYIRPVMKRYRSRQLRSSMNSARYEGPTPGLNAILKIC